MRTRATAALGSLPDPEFFERISEGMNRCVRNAASLMRDARRLGRGGRLRGSNVLVAFAYEEIAKYLILLDAVRCPRIQQDRSTQLKRFNDHLAKGLYVALYNGSPATFGEVRRKADLERPKFFLDGPNDVDWIFRNAILARREQLIYVDYVVRDEGSYWESPDTKHIGYCGAIQHRTYVYSVVLALHSAGVSTPEALAVVAKIWREQSFDDDTHWSVAEATNRRTLEALDAQGLLRTESPTAVGYILDRWLFPLYSLDLSERDVSLDELREQRASWSPE